MTMKFRRTCNSCNSTFFAPDKRANYCPKCLRKQEQKAAAVRDVPVTQPRPAQTEGATGRFPESKVEEKRFSDKRFGERRSGEGDSRRERSPLQRADDPFKRGKKSSGKRPQRPPKISELSDELRAKIEASYNQIKGNGEPLKKIHSAISNEHWVKVMLVANVIKEINAKARDLEHCSLPEEDKKKIIARYKDFIYSGERPVQGRRAVIAKELSLPGREVILAIREWCEKEIGELSRQQLFEIEKSYWRVAEEGKTEFKNLPKTLSSQLGFATPDQIARWIDQLLDDSKFTDSLSPITEEQEAIIIEEYKRYLAQAEPPEHALHRTLAAKANVTPLQVHRALCRYRQKYRPK